MITKTIVTKIHKIIKKLSEEELQVILIEVVMKTKSLDVILKNLMIGITYSEDKTFTNKVLCEDFINIFTKHDLDKNVIFSMGKDELSMIAFDEVIMDNRNGNVIINKNNS